MRTFNNSVRISTSSFFGVLLKVADFSSFMILISVLLLAIGSWLGLFIAPTDEVQGDAQRIMYLHVPSAWISMGMWFFVFISSLLFLATKDGRWDISAYSCAEIGAIFSFLNLVTGSIWGKPVWGVWWTWDARLTTTAILFLLYVAYIMLAKSKDDLSRTAKARAILGIIGAADLPVIGISVYLWRTLHQQSSVFKPGGPSIHPSMLWVLLFNVFAFSVLSIFFVIRRIKIEHKKIEMSEKLWET